MSLLILECISKPSYFEIKSEINNYQYKENIDNKLGTQQ